MAGPVGETTVRADVALQVRGLAPSRSAAARLIEAGEVSIEAGGRHHPVLRAAQPVDAGQRLVVAGRRETRFVSRAGDKLDAALAALGLDATARTVLDVGISTGGFSDCLLGRGAARIVGIDVGHGQLHPKLAGDDRITLFEGVNAREVDAARLGASMPADGFDLIVIDVSFISLTLVLPAVSRLAGNGATLLALVKPQFEVGRDGVDRRGIADPARLPAVRERVEAAVHAAGWSAPIWIESVIRGGDGNQEHFIQSTR